MTSENPSVTSAKDQTRGEALAQQTRDEHQALLEAIHQLEAALASAAPGREQNWNQRIIKTLETVTHALALHVSAVDTTDGLMAELDMARPDLSSRIGRLRSDHDDLLQQARALQQQVQNYGEGETPNVQDIRQRATWLLNALHHHQATETDLIYESFWTDIGIAE